MSPASRTPEAPPPHTFTVERVAEAFATDLECGLTATEASARLAAYGPNRLDEHPPAGWAARVLAQLRSFLVLILLAAALVSWAVGEGADAAAILAIVVLNAVLGVVQEARAERSLAALGRLAAPAARLLRDGRESAVPAHEVVPGDVVLLEAGNYVPADLRLTHTAGLQIEEASLTGEAVPAGKDARATHGADEALADRSNLAHMGTLVVAGRGRGVVVATGMRAALGRIAALLERQEEEPSPLQRKLDQLGRWLGIASLALCAVVFGLGLVRDTDVALLVADAPAYWAAHGRRLVDLFMSAVSLAIAAVPEGLPAVVTVCLALGMQRMARRNALIRRLPAVETLGSATVICTDKTGTLTRNQMTVVGGWLGRGAFDVTGDGDSSQGAFARAGAALDPSTGDLRLLLTGAVACNDARLQAPAGDARPTRSVPHEDSHQRLRIAGDPTEGALLVAAYKAGLGREAVDARLPRRLEIPFDAGRKRMVTAHAVRAPLDIWPSLAAGSEPERDTPAPSALVFVKGAPDVVLDLCAGVVVDEAVLPLTEAWRSEVLSALDAMARRALRVLAVAYRPLPAIPHPDELPVLESDLVLAGLLAMRDPARPEVREAVATASGAGLRTVMITGDHATTAAAIGEELGLLGPAGRVLSGPELEALDDAALAEVAGSARVYARVSPEHKVRIVEALRARGDVVAMTGDGVNDAPALKRADIGVAMGLTGTDVSREAADMVLVDDNYASIVSAVEEGRIIYANIRRFVYYLVSCNVGEILIVLGAMLAGLPLPLRPIQLLWLNLITDGAPAVALGAERGDPDVMRRPPRPPLMDRAMLAGVAVQGVVTTAAVLAAYALALGRAPDDLAAAQTVAFATLAVSELLRAFTARSERYTVFALNPLGNRWLAVSALSSLALLLAVIYVPLLRPLFGTVALGGREWLTLLPFAMAASVAAELTKLAGRAPTGSRSV